MKRFVPALVILAMLVGTLFTAGLPNTARAATGDYFVYGHTSVSGYAVDGCKLTDFIATTTCCAGTASDSDDATFSVSAQALKKEARSELESINCNDAAQGYINNAIDYINKSLNPKLWIDECRLVSNVKAGAKVFTYEKIAVLRLLEAQSADSSVASQIQSVIDNLTAADRMIAEIAIADAENAGSNQSYINKAKLKVSDGDALANSDPVHAIMYYKEAWRYAQRAM